jgi:hypothetical protein
VGESISLLVRRGAGAGVDASRASAPLRGRFALLPARAELVTAQHVRELMDRVGI